MTSSNGTAKAVPFPGYAKFQIYWRFDTAARRSPFDSAQGSQDSRRRLSPHEFGRRRLLVAEGFDRVEAGGAQGWNHPADQPYHAENHCRGNQSCGLNDQPDISRFAVLCECAV
jgi:hypothetical protein